MTESAADAVFVGAGHNSLACAAHLAAKGWKVALFEQADHPGGAVRTAELTLPGFRHDCAAMNLSLFAGSQFFQRYSAELMAKGLRFCAVDQPFASVFPDGRWLGISTDPARNLARISEFSRNDAAAWKDLTENFPQRAGQLGRLLSGSAKISAFASFALHVMRRAGTGGSLELLRFVLLSPRRWLEETFESPQMRAMLAAWGMHLDFAPDIAGGAMFPYLEGQAGQAFGMVLGEGGADTIITAMQAMIEARGGRVTCKAPVRRVVHAGGRATGIELADGRRIAARRAVIANVAPGALARLTGGTGNARYDRGLAQFEHAPGTLMLHLALSDLPDWAAGEELRRFAYVHIAPEVDDMARTYQQARAGLLPDRPVIVCGQPTAFDPSRAPAGKHILWLQVRMVPARIRGDAAGQITARDWAGAAEPFAERALDIVEAYAPGTRGKILGRRIVTPVDLEADNPNLVGGDQVCGSHHLSQNFLFRPLRGFADGRTPIRGLFHTGAAVWPGAGTGAGPGYLLARKLAGK